MSPMRKRFKYGVPAAAGLGVAGMAASEDENPAAVLGAGAAGALGAAAGLVGARSLAGKYSPVLVNAIKKGGQEAQDFALEQATKMREGGLRQKALLELADVSGGPAAEAAAKQATESVLKRNIGLGLVPSAAAAAGLGGVAAGRAVGAIGQAMGIDPEAPGSSNTMGSRMSMQSPMLPMY